MNSDDLRNWLSSVANELRAHKWVLPLLGLLVAAAVVIPVVLAKSGKPAPLAAVPPAPSVTVPVPTTVATTTRHHAPSQNYLTGPAHNPFVSAASTSSATSTSPATTATSPSAGGTGGSSVGTNRSSSLSGTGTGAATVTVTTPAKTRTVTKTTPAKAPTKIDRYANFEAELSLLQVGVASSPTVFHDVARDQLLPADNDAFGAFLGVRTDGKTAVFVLADDTSVSGQGRCAPSAGHCEFLTLEPGDKVTVEFFPASGSMSTFTLRYVMISKVMSSGLIANVDTSGAADVKQASAYISQLQSARYAPYTGLLSIELGATVPVVQ